MNAPDYCGQDLSVLFTLYVALTNKEHGNARLAIRAFDANHTDPRTGHQRIDVEAILYENDPRCPLRARTRRVIFKRGDTYCAVPRGTTLDGNEARELVMSLVAMKPGDTDDEYFEHYTEEQIAFVERYGDDIGCERERRYCDENGGVR